MSPWHGTLSPFPSLSLLTAEGLEDYTACMAIHPLAWKPGLLGARPSGTEDVYKLYAESFRGKDHLRRIQKEAQTLVTKALAAST